MEYEVAKQSLSSYQVGTMPRLSWDQVGTKSGLSWEPLPEISEKTWVFELVGNSIIVSG